MKLIKQIFFTTFILFSISTNAQFDEVSINMSKGNQRGLKIKSNQLTKDIAFQAVTEVLTEKNANTVAVFNSDDEIFFNNLSLPLISPLKCFVYGIFSSLDSSLIICVGNEEKMINSNNSLSEMLGVQSFCLEIKRTIDNISKAQNIDSIKAKINRLETEYKNVSEEIDKLKRVVKTDTKEAAKDEKSAIKTNEQQKYTVSEIEQTNINITNQEKALNEFPLEQLNNEIKFKNSNISSNRKMIKKLAKSNRKLTDRIINERTEVEVNKRLIASSQNNTKELKKLNKAQLKHEGKINKYQSQIDFNNQNIQLKRIEIRNDSIVVVQNEKKIEDFDVKGRQREINKLKNKKQDLEKKNVKQQTKIENSTTEADLKRKEADAAQSKTDTLIKEQQRIKIQIDALKEELKILQR